MLYVRADVHWGFANRVAVVILASVLRRHQGLHRKPLGLLLAGVPVIARLFLTRRLDGGVTFLDRIVLYAVGNTEASGERLMSVEEGCGLALDS